MRSSTAALLLAVAMTLPLVSGTFTLGKQGESCAATCGRQGRLCDPHVQTDNSTDIFKQLGVTCNPLPKPWWAPDQPSFVTGNGDPNLGDCLGWKDVPVNTSCDASFWSVRRLCNCGEDISASKLFGTGLSGGTLHVNETTIFAHTIAEGNVGVMNHFWVTAPPHALDEATIRYYVDGEEKASIEFAPGLAAGVGFGDDAAPRGTKWTQLGAGNGHGSSYSMNFNIPFQKSIVVTAQHKSAQVGGFYMIVRGALNKPINIGGVALPKTAKLQLQKFEGTLQPLEFLNVVDVPSGSGLHFMSTLAVQSGNLNFLEGCYHAYTPYTMTFPGLVMSTGTEDYFDSAWYFDAGSFYFPVCGFTHMNKTSSSIAWSAYRFHEMDPLMFDNGFKFAWRNGDMVDPHSGHKCFTETGGKVVGSPTASQVVSYAWVYVW